MRAACSVAIVCQSVVRIVRIQSAGFIGIFILIEISDRTASSKAVSHPPEKLMSSLSRSAQNITQALRHPLGYVAARLVSVALLVYAQSCLAGSIPAGLSVWQVSSCDNPVEQERKRCNPYSAEVTLFRKGKEVCGVLNQSWTKAPGGWFAGTVTVGRAEVRYVDSFQSNSDDFGRAVIATNGLRLSWRVLKSPEGGLLGNETALKRNKPAEKVSGPPPQSCADLEKLSSPVDIHLP